MSSIIAVFDLSLERWPMNSILVKPAGKFLNLGATDCYRDLIALDVNKVLFKKIWDCASFVLALRINFSIKGLTSFAFARVVVILWCSMRLVARFRIKASLWFALRPNLRPLILCLISRLLY